MTSLDLAVILAYFAATLGLGLWVTRGQRTSGDYFLGARDLPAWAVLLSIVATETSALTVISVPGIGARSDFGFLQLTFGYLLGRMAVAAWLLPGYFRGHQETAYARLESRFGGGTRRLVSASFLVTRLLGDGVRIFAGAIPLSLVTGWSIPLAIVVMGVVTIAYLGRWAQGRRLGRRDPAGDLRGRRPRGARHRLVAGGRGRGRVEARGRGRQAPHPPPAGLAERELYPAGRAGRGRDAQRRLPRHRPADRSAAARDPVPA
jgi:hypothetical protein